jgi:hypothetical protein
MKDWIFHKIDPVYKSQQQVKVAKILKIFYLQSNLAELVLDGK